MEKTHLVLQLFNLDSKHGHLKSLEYMKMTDFDSLHCGNSTGFCSCKKWDHLNHKPRYSRGYVCSVHLLPHTVPWHQTCSAGKKTKAEATTVCMTGSDFLLYYLMVPLILCLSLPRLPSICWFSGPRRERDHIWTHLIDDLLLVWSFSQHKSVKNSLFSFLFSTPGHILLRQRLIYYSNHVPEAENVISQSP